MHCKRGVAWAEKHACSNWLSTYMYLSLVHIIYSCKNVLEVHRYFPVHVEQMLHLLCKLFLSRHRTAYLVILGT